MSSENTQSSSKSKIILRPVQDSIRRSREGIKICDSVHMAAYEVYSHAYGPQEALIEGNCRGGFAVSKLIAFLYARAYPKLEWKKRVEEAFEGSVNL